MPADFVIRHEAAMASAVVVSKANTKIDNATAIVAMVKGLQLYATAYERQYGSTIATDHVLGAYWETIAHALRGLLNGEIGRLDGGLTDKAICDALESAGFNPDVEGEKL